MQPELLLPPTWPNYNLPYSTLDHKMFYDQEIDLSSMIEGCDFSYSFQSPDESMISSSSTIPAMIMDELFDSCNEVRICSSVEGIGAISEGDIEGICEWINQDGYNIETNSPSDHDLTMEGDGWSSSLSSESNQNSVFPLMEVDDQITLVHLLRGYGEAMEKGEKELSEVIMNSISSKSSPLGNTVERVAYNLFQSREGQGEYLREEASKNLAAAFKVLYQCLPNGRLAHLAANSAIFDSIPDYAGVLHVVDFDMGEGIQWPPLMEALSKKGKAVRITSIKSEEESTSLCNWSFEDTKKRLLFHARECGLRLQIEEKGIEEIGSEMTRMKKRGLEREWVAFNCMTALPHMGRRRPKASVDVFLREAKALVTGFGGILVIGDGEARENSDTCNSYSSYFDSLQRHYQAVMESLERNFPAYLAEARAAMESLFLGPLMCPGSWFQDWEETRKGRDLQAETWLEGRKIGLGSLVEAKEMVGEGEKSYSVRIEGLRENEMVLRWKETPLVRVSTWM